MIVAAINWVDFTYSESLELESSKNSVNSWLKAMVLSKHFTIDVFNSMDDKSIIKPYFRKIIQKYKPELLSQSVK